MRMGHPPRARPLNRTRLHHSLFPLSMVALSPLGRRWQRRCTMASVWAVPLRTLSRHLQRLSPTGSVSNLSDSREAHPRVLMNSGQRTLRRESGARLSTDWVFFWMHASAESRSKCIKRNRRRTPLDISDQSLFLVIQFLPLLFGLPNLHDYCCITVPRVSIVDTDSEHGAST